jgi:hypothetical protein
MVGTGEGRGERAPKLEGGRARVASTRRRRATAVVRAPDAVAGVESGKGTPSWLIRACTRLYYIQYIPDIHFGSWEQMNLLLKYIF